MVTVFGLGFVGLTTALGFAHLGYKVFGIDVDRERMDTLGSGNLPFMEPQMDEVLRKQLNRNFFLTDDIETAIRESEYVFYCVGTPYGSDGAADLTYLFQAIDRTIDSIQDDKFRVLVTKSTIPPTTTAEKILPYVQGKGAVSKQLGIANNPEFLREGYCWDDFLHADRIVAGCNDPVSAEMMEKLYAPMDIPFFCVTHSTGEFIKYLSNTLLATLISYSNEMSEIADAMGDIQVAEAFRILHMDKRWGGCNMTSYVYPGCGYGGYCLPKDTCALYAQSKEKGYEPKILENVIAVNDNRFETIANKIVKGLDAAKTIGILGLSFKPGSDDVRDASAAKIARILREKGYVNIQGFDPVAMEEFGRLHEDLNVSMVASAKALCETSDVIAIVTAWEEFREVVKGYEDKIIDCRYML